jgi:CubicO group peptidase (beta-lactamase class C family)
MKKMLALLLFACALRAAERPWRQWTNVADAGYDAAALAATRALADDAHSAAVFAVADENVIAAWGAVDRKLELHSMRKSVYAALWGIAEARGLVRLDATLAQLGVDDLQALTAEEKGARLVDLLHARSGVYHPAAYATSDQEEARPARGSHARDTFWFYNNWDFNVAGALLERVTGKPLGILIDQWLAKPLGMQDYVPSDVFAVLEPHVSRWPALTIRMSARDLARFGELWLNEGRWGGRQLIPAAFIARASAAASNIGAPGQGYAMMWWVYDAGSVDAKQYPNASHVRLLLARGVGGQTLAIVPEAHLVIVHRADTDRGRRVPGPVVWSIIDRVLGAHRAAPARRARLSTVHVEPFASELPPFQWPAAIAIAPSAMQAVAGDYELRPGVVAHVFTSDGRLFASMPGRGEAELFATSATDFFLRLDSGTTVHFDVGDDGTATRVRLTMAGKELVAKRLTAANPPAQR